MAGGAKNSAMLIAGRAVQGLGTAGIFAPLCRNDETPKDVNAMEVRLFTWCGCLVSTRVICSPS